ncbi:MAG TPA: hypothetical protein VNF05_03875 [Acidimicrobiales bacterium]|nr:hypothetical protein [Acidimicrobiales bacterium]
MAFRHALGTTRDRLLTVLITGAVLEILWTVFLGWRLPRHHIAYHWDVAWVGLDVAEILMLLGAAWAAWRRRAVLILFSIASATLLLLDAWFDVTTSGRKGLEGSLLLAVIVEVPSAVALLWVARRAAHALLTTQFTRGHLAELPLRNIPLTPTGDDQ